jgi:hypothetical protein
MPFDAWWYLRFQLPGFPILAALTVAALAAVSSRIRASGAIAVLFVAGAALIGVNSAKAIDLRGEYRYRIIGEWVRDRLPENALLVTMQHSGSLRMYSGRPTIRYDMIPPGEYEAAIDELVAARFHPYVVVDEWEVEHVRQQHGAGPRGALDWQPIAILPINNVQVFDLAERPAPDYAPEIIPPRSR